MCPPRQPKSGNNAIDTLHETPPKNTNFSSEPQYRRYVERLCRSFMQYGGPLCVLENFIDQLPAATIAIDHYMYVPGYMLVDWSYPGQACEPEIWKEKEGLDFCRLHLTQDIHQRVSIGSLSIEEASYSLDCLMLWRPKYRGATTIIAKAVSISALAMMLPGSVLADIPVILALGGALGLLRQFSPHSPISYNLIQFLGAPMISLYRFYLLKSKLIALNASSISSLPSVCAFMQALTIDALFVPLSGIMLSRKPYTLASYALRMTQVLFFACMLQVGGSLSQSISIHIESPFIGTQIFARVPESYLVRRVVSLVIFVTCATFLMRAKYQTIPLTLVIFGTVTALYPFMLFICEPGLSCTLTAFFGSFLGDIVCYFVGLSPAPTKLSMFALFLANKAAELEHIEQSGDLKKFRLSIIAWISIRVVLGFWLGKMLSRVLKIRII